MGIAPRLIVKESTEKWKAVRDITDTELQKLRNKDFVIDKYHNNIEEKLLIPYFEFDEAVKSIIYKGSGKKYQTSSLLDLSINRAQYLDILFESNFTTILGIEKNKDFIENDIGNLLSAKSNLEKLKKSSNQEINQWSKTSKIDFIVGDITKNIKYLELQDEDYTEKSNNLLFK